ncbi:MAG: SPASM domain-containing protein [Candidatus Peribacteria bacterium]|nr:MAG: SPASM domain-containing protein [Candidatus Peribacteria bacterium]
MEQNKKTKKKIHFALVSNLTMIDDAIMDKLLSYPNFSISTSLDGDKQTHDFARLMIGKGKDISSFDTLSKKIHFIREKEKKAGKRLLGGAMGVITKKTLTRYKELVDTYVELGFDSIFLKKINALGFAENTKNTIGYSTEELQTFYKNYYGHLVELFEKGTIIRDGFLSITLGKILKPEKTNFMDLRSPCGAAIGQIAYDYTGKIYTCDEGRMVDDDVFKIGDTDNSLQELIQNDIVGAMMDASTVESLPCDICAYAPYCGVCPIESYQGRGNIYTNQVFDAHCSFFMFLFDWIFEILSNKDSLEYKFLMSQVI